VEYRCAAIRGKRRCQLVAGHDGIAHASAAPGDKKCQRWDKSGSWLDQGDRLGSFTAERLPWTALKYD
jgi:hypothetical protein